MAARLARRPCAGTDVCPAANRMAGDPARHADYRCRGHSTSDQTHPHPQCPARIRSASSGDSEIAVLTRKQFLIAGAALSLTGCADIPPEFRPSLRKLEPESGPF